LSREVLVVVEEVVNAISTCVCVCVCVRVMEESPGHEDSGNSGVELPPDFFRDLIFGCPFSQRAEGHSEPSIDPVAVRNLNLFMDEVVSILREEHGSANRAFRQAERELYDIRHMPIDCPHAIACKRGVVLYALWKEPCFKERFLESDAALMNDLCNRILPIVVPIFVANLAQRPDAFVALCATLAIMWPGEQMRIPLQLPQL
jgi:hypothetical protein